MAKNTQYPVIDGKKECTRCSLVKPVDQYSRCSNSKSGVASWCKVCAKKHRQDFRRVSNLPVPQIGYPVINGLKKCYVCLEELPVIKFEYKSSGVLKLLHRHKCKDCYDKSCITKRKRTRDYCKKNAFVRCQKIARQVEQLSDIYIKRLVIKTMKQSIKHGTIPAITIKQSDISEELVILKRNKLVLHRKLKQKRHEEQKDSRINC